MGSREGESGDYVRMCELPIDYIPELMRGREDYFGIWISKVALRHFESLKCRLAVDGDIFLKIERYFVPEWGEYSDKNSRVTPITNEKREELGICFSVQFTRLGFIQLHLSSGEDIEYFMTDFFRIFKEILSDEETEEFLDALMLERLDKRAFYVHEARHMGDKKVVDEKFKGAHIKINDVFWFGKTKYDARIDYSEPMQPHIEAEGPQPQVSNFMELVDGFPKGVRTLSEMRELSYRTRDKVGDIYAGVGHLSHQVCVNHQDSMQYLSEIDAKQHIRTLQQEIGIAGLKSSHNHLHTKIDTLYTHTTKSYEQTTAALYDVTSNMKKIASGIGSIATIQTTVKEELHNHIDHRATQTEQLIIDTSNTILERLTTSFTTISKRVKDNLFLLLRKLDQIPGQTAKELSRELNVSYKTVYSYLKKLQEKNLISSYSEKKKGASGRPSKRFKLFIKKLK